MAIAALGQTETGVTPWPEVLAGSVLLCLPALVAVLFAQRYVTKRPGLGSREMTDPPARLRRHGHDD